MLSDKIAVIGSNSFSGSSFSNYLLDLGYRVYGFSRSVEPDSVFLPYKWNNKSDNFIFNQIDLNHDVDRLINIIKDNKIQYIVNFAALGMVAQSWKKPDDWYQTNVVGQVKFHDSLRKLNNIEKYIHITTPEVYGSTNGWIKESYSFNPSTPYAVSRAACDLHLMSFFHAYEFPVIFTRAANVYGPAQQLYRIIPRPILFSKINKQLHLHGGGYSERSFIHIDDLIKYIRNKIPHACIGTDVITGFPGETNVLFERTFDYIKNSELNYLHVFPYSDRKGTKASMRNDKISDYEKKKRSKLLRSLSSDLKNNFASRFIGKELVGIKEKNNKIRTNNYIDVIIESEIYNPGDIGKVLINKVENNKVFGKIINPQIQ